MEAFFVTGLVTILVEHPDFQSGGPWVRVPAGSLKLPVTWKLFYYKSVYIFTHFPGKSHLSYLFLLNELSRYCCQSMPVCYIIYSDKLDKYYVGACINLERRLYEHNIGHSKFTSTGLPWRLVYTEQFVSLNDAKKREGQIKKMKSRKYIEVLVASR